MSPITRIVIIALAGLALATQMGNGCVSDDGGYSDDRYRDAPPYRGDESYRRGDDSRSGSGVRLPRDAQLVAEGRDVIRYRADRPGRVYLYDADARSVVDDRALGRGEEYIVSPKDDRAWIGDERVLTYDFDRDRSHRIYFVPDNRSARDEPRRDEPRRDDPTAGPTKPKPDSPPVFGGGGAGAAVPKSARILAEGRGSDLSFKADGIGTVYIYDADNKSTVATYRLKDGQRFTISPTSGEAAVDGKVVFRKSLSNKRTYKLYFDLNV